MINDIEDVGVLLRRLQSLALFVLGDCSVVDTLKLQLLTAREGGRRLIRVLIASHPIDLHTAHEHTNTMSVIHAPTESDMRT